MKTGWPNKAFFLSDFRAGWRPSPLSPSAPPAQDSRPDQRKAHGCLRMLGDKKGSCPDKKGS